MQKTLLASSSAAALQGPKIRRPASTNASTMPAVSGASGPTTVRLIVLVLANLTSRGTSVRWNVDVLGVDRGAGVAGRNEHAVDAAALADLPRQGVFAAAITNHQHFHRRVHSPFDLLERFGDRRLSQQCA